jgi:predicted nuclease with TOPRIM domain
MLNPLLLILAEVGEQLTERAKDAAALALRQAREQLTAQKDAIEARLKSVTDELAQTQADKEKAEATAAKAKQDLDQVQTAQKAAEQVSPVTTAPQAPAPTP